MDHATQVHRSPQQLRSEIARAERLLPAIEARGEMDLAGMIRGHVGRLRVQLDAALAAEAAEVRAQRDTTSRADIPQILQGCLDSFAAMRHGAAGVRV